MVVFSANSHSPASGAPSTLTPLFANRFQLLEEYPHDDDDDDDSKPHLKFQALGVYKPPHMRTIESVASTVESDSTANGTSVVHGQNLDREQKGASRPHTPHVDPTPKSATFGVSELKRKIHEEVLNVRKAAEEMETIEKEFLEEAARFEKDVQVLRRAGLADEEIRELVGLNPEKFPPSLTSLKPSDANSLGIDLARINLASEQEVEQQENKCEEQQTQQTPADSVNKTPIPGGAIYSSVNHSRGMHQTGNYGHSATPANDAHHDTFARQATGGNEQARSYMGHHGSIPIGTLQVPGQIYQATPMTSFNSVDLPPPRFRQMSVHHQPIPLHYQNFAPNPNRSRDVVPVGHHALWPPIQNQPQNPILNHTFRPASIPPPRPYFYEVDLTFDFDGIALSSNCNRDYFVKTYCKRNGFSPSQAAWAAWATAVERVRHAQQDKYQKAVEREMKERLGAGSRLPRWCENLLGDSSSGSEPGYSSSSSDASTKVASSRNSEVSEEGSMVVSAVGPNGKRGVQAPRVEKRWKDVADKTWAFGEPPRSDDPEHYMTHVVEKLGWQVYDPRLE